MSMDLIFKATLPVVLLGPSHRALEHRNVVTSYGTKIADDGMRRNVERQANNMGGVVAGLLTRVNGVAAVEMLRWSWRWTKNNVMVWDLAWKLKGLAPETDMGFLSLRVRSALDEHILGMRTKLLRRKFGPGKMYTLYPSLRGFRCLLGDQDFRVRSFISETTAKSSKRVPSTFTPQRTMLPGQT